MADERLMTGTTTSLEATAPRGDLRSRRPGLAHCIAVCAITGSFTLGCGQQKLCEELGDCGGDFLGSWALGPDRTSCSEDFYVAPSDKRQAGGDIPAQRLSPNEQAVSDWCAGLIASDENVLQATPLFYGESMPWGVASLDYQTNGTYTFGVVRTGTFRFEFSAACMRAFGAIDNRPAQGGTEPVSLCKQLEVPLAMAGIGEGSYRNTTCEVNPAELEGCICTYDIAEVTGSAGTYRQISANEILHMPSFPNFPYRVTYCVQGDTLEVTGSDGQLLFGKAALRTMKMGKVNCTDGILGFGEDEVDCGPACGACPTCTDGVQNRDETGTDCGGSCPMPCPP